MRNEEITAMKNDLTFYVQKVINIMASQFPSMPKIVSYNVTFDTRYGWSAHLIDIEGGSYFVYPGCEVTYREPGWLKKIKGNKLSATAATMTDV